MLRHWIIALTLVVFTARSARADVVLDWNALALNAIRTENIGPTLSTRNLAILHTAIYDAVNSIVRTHQPYRFQVDSPAGSSPEAAAVAAAYEVIKLLYPSFAAPADDLYANYLAASTPDASLTNGLALGRQVATLIVQSRSDDGANTDVPYIPSNSPGQWQRTPPFYRPPLTPQWRYVDPFCLPDIEPFVPGPPPALDSPEYAVAFNEVKAIGGKTSTVRTAEQSTIAVFWSDFSYTAMPPGHWHEIAATIARNQGNSLFDNARLFALLSLAQADAAIVCWEAKFRYNLWRPVTAIQRADEDGNAATEKDVAWNHFLNSPPFPAYTSGHSSFSKASAQVLTHFYNTDTLAFSATSDSLPGVSRSFNSLAACADEVGLSRIYGGIHYSFDNVQGKRSGGRIGDYVSANFLLPNSRLPALRFEAFANGAVQLRVHGRFGASASIEASTDLQRWQAIFTNSTVMGGFTLQDPPAGEGRRFYRAVER